MFKKIRSLSKTGLKPYQIGKEKLENPDTETEKLAEERADICAYCPLFSEEPITQLRVEDTRLPKLSGKICGDCGCSSPYLLRQNIKICRNW